MYVCVFIYIYLEIYSYTYIYNYIYIYIYMFLLLLEMKSYHELRRVAVTFRSWLSLSLLNKMFVHDWIEASPFHVTVSFGGGFVPFLHLKGLERGQPSRFWDWLFAFRKTFDLIVMRASTSLALNACGCRPFKTLHLLPAMICLIVEK